MKNSVEEMIQSLKYVSEHLTEETDKGIINNCILLLQELSYNEINLLAGIKVSYKFLDEYNELLHHINGIRNIKTDDNTLSTLNMITNMCANNVGELSRDKKYEEKQPLKEQEQDW